MRHDDISVISMVIASVAFGLLISSTAARAQADREALRGDEAVLPGAFIPDDKWRPADLPSAGDVDQALTELDSNEGARVYTTDLNGDRKPEFLLTSRESICGTGGCPYILLASGSMKRLGTFFGHLAILDEHLNVQNAIWSCPSFVDTPHRTKSAVGECHGNKEADAAELIQGNFSWVFAPAG